ncbi:hypothetical protein ACFQMA_22305 [Halosimplex aquaticum]|uniref:Lipoprotein n=1 Tax=Halosimplex aquaticum TaxID=3026162 RepID=A0ABD5YB48_9EURY|nr:hypothetical protein [Halosimplex aquaticum]
MRVHAVALVALLAVTAGCSALGGQSPDATTETPAPTEAPTDEPCRTDLLLTSEGNDRVTPKPLPEERPDQDPEAVGQFAREYERAFAHNHEIGERARDVTVELQGTTVRSVDGGYRVRVHVWTRTVVDPPTAATDTGTTTRESFYDAHYFVSEGVVRRAETERHGTLPDDDLSQSGLTLACWE